jgi:hypothetical protein
MNIELKLATCLSILLYFIQLPAVACGNVISPTDAAAKPSVH